MVMYREWNSDASFRKDSPGCVFTTSCAGGAEQSGRPHACAHSQARTQCTDTRTYVCTHTPAPPPPPPAHLQEGHEVLLHQAVAARALEQLYEARRLVVAGLQHPGRGGRSDQDQDQDGAGREQGWGTPGLHPRPLPLPTHFLHMATNLCTDTAPVRSPPAAQKSGPFQ